MKNKLEKIVYEGASKITFPCGGITVCLGELDGLQGHLGEACPFEMSAVMGAVGSLFSETCSGELLVPAAKLWKLAVWAG